MQFANPILGGTTLVRNAIQSQNFVTGSAGWQIQRNGSAEFNNLTVRGGAVIGGSIVMDGTGEGLFIYNGTPALGNLIVSLAAFSGTDSYGNAYPAGLNVTTGTIAGASISGGSITGTTITVGSGSNSITIDPTTKTITLTGSNNSDLVISAGANLGETFNPDTTAFTDGSITGHAVGTPGFYTAGQLALKAPTLTGSRTAQLQLFSQTITEADLIVDTATTNEGVIIVRVASSTDTSASAGVTTEAITDTVTFSSVNGAVYGVTWQAQFTSTVTTDQALMRLRQTNISGTILQSGRTANANATLGTEYAEVTGTGSNVTVVGTAQRVGTGTLTRDGSSTTPSRLIVNRVG